MRALLVHSLPIELIKGTQEINTKSITVSDVKSRTTREKAGILGLAVFVFVLGVAPSLLGSANASGTSYSFNLLGPNIARAANTIPGTPVQAGDTLRLTGSGSFDTNTKTASGGGSFTHYRPDGSVFVKGVWVATDFNSFVSYGGPRSGTQGGLLNIKVTLIAPEATFAGLTMQVSCLVNAPPGAAPEGTTIIGPPLFTTAVSGQTLFHLDL